MLYFDRRPEVGTCFPDRFGLRGAYFELAVFDDGTLAVDGGACVEQAGLSVRKLSSTQLSALRDLVGDICFDLRTSRTYCSDGPKLHLFCSLDSRKAELRENCGFVGNEFMEQVAQILGIERDLIGYNGDLLHWKRHDIGSTVRLAASAPRSPP